MTNRPHFSNPYSRVIKGRRAGILLQWIGLDVFDRYLFERKKVMKMTAKKQDGSRAEGTVMFLTQEQLEKAVANYMRSTMFKPEFKIAIISVIPADQGYRVEFCDPALLALGETSLAD